MILAGFSGAAATASCFRAGEGLPTQERIEVYQFDHRHLGTVSLAKAQFQHASIAPGPIHDRRGNRAIQLLDSLFILKVGEEQPPVGLGIFFSPGQERLNVASQRFCLRDRSSKAFMSDEGERHISQKGLTMLLLSP